MLPVLAHGAAMTSADAAVILLPLAALLFAARRVTGRRLPSGLARAAAITCLFGAQYIHWSVVDPHWAEWAPAGVFFVVTALAEGMLAVGLIVSRSRRLQSLAVAFNLATVAVWAVSRTIGLPIGPGAGRPEALGRGDYIASLFEIAAVLLLCQRLAGEGTDGAPSRPPHHRLLAGGMVVYVLGVTAYGLAAADQHHARRGEAVEATADVRLEAAALRFATATFTLPASRPARVLLANHDRVPHNLAIFAGSSRPVFRGAPTEAGSTTAYAFDAPGAGTYAFGCEIHPQMSGTLLIV